MKKCSNSECGYYSDDVSEIYCGICGCMLEDDEEELKYGKVVSVQFSKESNEVCFIVDLGEDSGIWEGCSGMLLESGATEGSRVKIASVSEKSSTVVPIEENIKIGLIDTIYVLFHISSEEESGVEPEETEIIEMFPQKKMENTVIEDSNPTIRKTDNVLRLVIVLFTIFWSVIVIYKLIFG